MPLLFSKAMLTGLDSVVILTFDIFERPVGQTCIGGNTVSTTATICPPAFDHASYITFTPTPVETSPPPTTTPAPTQPPPPPATIIPGLSWHIFTGALYGWSATICGCRASIHPWILGNVSYSVQCMAYSWIGRCGVRYGSLLLMSMRSKTESQSIS